MFVFRNRSLGISKIFLTGLTGFTGWMKAEEVKAGERRRVV